MWEWPGEEYSLQTDSRSGMLLLKFCSLEAPVQHWFLLSSILNSADFSHFLWDDVNTNEDGLLYMLEEQTPIKDCTDFGYQVSDIGGILFYY